MSKMALLKQLDAQNLSLDSSKEDIKYMNLTFDYNNSIFADPLPKGSHLETIIKFS